MPTVIVTGANRGIGLELARQYAADGWRVVATARDPGRAEALRAVPGVDVRPLDVRDPAAIADFAAGLKDLTVDVLVNNAGVLGPEPDRQDARHLDPEGWVETMRVNALAPVLLTLALRPALARAARPRVATISSVMGSVAGSTAGGRYAYRMSKAAVNMGNRSLSLDLRGDGIACIVMHPGWVQTDMGGSGAPVAPADSAAGIRRVIDGLTLDDTGRFLDYRGEALPW
ncbi:MAG TPA: SDR family oxidoreductase [Azospirillaceae bacterium]|nr:SDR family oxidoreductase [Azospirillaceae bacterium]